MRNTPKAGARIGLHFALTNDGAPVEEFATPHETPRGSAWEKPCLWGVVQLGD